MRNLKFNPALGIGLDFLRALHLLTVALGSYFFNAGDPPAPVPTSAPVSFF